MPARPCHTEDMNTYTVVPRGGAYWIEAIANDGPRRLIERFDTEDAAVQRLRALQAEAGIVNHWNDPVARADRG